MAVCDDKSRFTYVNIGGYGSESDGGIFKNSSLGKLLANNQIDLPDESPVNGTNLPYFIVGDAAFPLRPYLMTPYSGRDLDMAKSWHNRELSRGRICIENAFGILSARWQVFLSTIAVCPQNADAIVMASVLLHNFVMMHSEHMYATHTFVDRYDNNGNITQGEWRDQVRNRNSMLQVIPPRFRMGSRNASNYAKSVRDTVKDFLMQ